MIRIGSRVWCVKNGVLVHSGRNLVTTAGLALIAARMKDNVTNAPGYMAIGTDGSTTTAAMTALQGTEVERKSFTSASASGPSISFKATFGADLGAAATIREYGIFNAATGGTMLSRFLSSDVVLEPGDTYEVTWALDFEYIEEGN